MKILHQVYEDLFFAGLSEEAFQEVKKPVGQANQRAIIAWSISMCMFWIMSLILGLFIPVYAQCSPVYLGGVISSSFTLFCALFLIKRYPWLLNAVMSLLALSVLMVGIGIAVYQPHDKTATMIAMVVMIPTCFITPTIRSVAILGVIIGVYIIAGEDAIDRPIFNWGLLNLFIFSIAGLVTGHVINKTRFRRFLYEDSSKKMAEMQANLNDRLVMGIGTMVDSRDISTGGHSRRTATGVRFLVEAMRKDESLALTDSFCDKVIKAAPMHDIGKIAVDDVILRKPGKYTPEEFEEMKKHAAEGARVLHEIFFDGDEEFCRIAMNVAHYHHERVDGTGYPEGRKGDEIPLEARIMAIADVYDALVSRRVYKERFTPEKADRTIRDGMGSQFDAKLEKYYEEALPRLEEFYSRDLREEEMDAPAGPAGSQTV